MDRHAYETAAYNCILWASGTSRRQLLARTVYMRRNVVGQSRSQPTLIASRLPSTARLHNHLFRGRTKDMAKLELCNFHQTIGKFIRHLLRLTQSMPPTLRPTTKP